ncbi:MAG: DUF6691 family protein [Polyangiales bacterium]
MKANFSAALGGAVFAVGLAISGMTQPAKVVGFLDLTRIWDPSLAFVMIGAIGVHALLRLFITRRDKPVFDDKFHTPPDRGLDAKLLVGAGLFGVGWGLGGYCPGPALVSLASGAIAPVVFVGAMTVGILVAGKLLPD